MDEIPYLSVVPPAPNAAVFDALIRSAAERSPTGKVGVLWGDSFPWPFRRQTRHVLHEAFIGHVLGSARSLGIALVPIMPALGRLSMPHDFDDVDDCGSAAGEMLGDPCFVEAYAAEYRSWDPAIAQVMLLETIVHRPATAVATAQRMIERLAQVQLAAVIVPATPSRLPRHFLRKHPSVRLTGPADPPFPAVQHPTTGAAEWGLVHWLFDHPCTATVARAYAYAATTFADGYQSAVILHNRAVLTADRQYRNGFQMLFQSLREQLVGFQRLHRRLVDTAGSVVEAAHADLVGYDGTVLIDQLWHDLGSRAAGLR